MKDKKTREDIELMFIKIMDILDKTKMNSEFLQEKFAKMSDTAFWKWLERKFPLQFQHRAWDIEPTFVEYKKALNLLDLPLTQKICLPHIYRNKQGVPVNSKEALPIVIILKRMQQFQSKKSHISARIERRDMQGRLTSDKGAATSDREFNSMLTMGLQQNAKEFSSFKADALDAASEANAQIMNTGSLSMKDIHLSKDDSISRNLLYYMLLGCHIESNLVGSDGYTPYTLEERKQAISRES